jgi:hypothetical protein
MDNPPKVELPFIDPTGSTVLALVSDPLKAIALDAPSIGERPPAPDWQLLGPPGDEPADNLI